MNILEVESYSGKQLGSEVKIEGVCFGCIRILQNNVQEIAPTEILAYFPERILNRLK